MSDFQMPAVAAAPSIGPAQLTPAEATRRLREAFLDRGWPTSADVGIWLGSAADLRTTGQLLGAWSSHNRTYVHPDCQFDAVNQVRPVMRELLRILPADGDDGGWRRTFWLYGPSDAFGGHAPADLLASDPKRVLVAARREFLKDVHAG